MNKKYLIFIFLLLVCLCNYNPTFAQEYYYYLESQGEELIELYRKSYELKKENKYEESIECYKKALKINPKHMLVISGLCECYNFLHNSSELEKYARMGLSIAQYNVVNKHFIGAFYYYLGESYKLEEKYDSAMRYFLLSIKNSPDIISNFLGVAYCFEKNKKYKEASEFYKRIESVNPKYFKDNNLDKIIEILEKKELETNPVSYHLEMALKNIKEKKLKDFGEEYKKALEIEPDNIEALLGITNYLLFFTDQEDKYKEIIKYCEKIQDLFYKGDNVNDFFYDSYLLIYKQLSFAYENLNNIEMANEYKEANKSFQLFLEARKAFYEDKHINLAYINYKQAVDNFKLNKIPYNYYMLEEFLHFLIENEKLEDAKEYLTKAINQAKKDKNKTKLTLFTSLVGKYYAYKKEYEKALKYYNKAFEEETNIDRKYKYKYCIATIYIDLRDKDLRNIDKALKEFDECIKLVDGGAKDTFDVLSEKIKFLVFFDDNSDFIKAKSYHDKGVKLFNEGKYMEAIKYLEKALKFAQLNNNTLSYLCQSLYFIKEYEKSFKVAKEGLLVSNQDENYDNYATFCSYITLYYDEIAKDYEKCLEYSLLGYNKKPSNKMLHNVGVSYVHLKQFDKALEVLKNYDYKDTPYVECLKLLALCYEINNQIKEAYDTYEIAKQLAPNDEEISISLSKCKKAMKNMK